MNLRVKFFYSFGQHSCSWQAYLDGFDVEIFPIIENDFDLVLMLLVELVGRVVVIIRVVCEHFALYFVFFWFALSLFDKIKANLLWELNYFLLLIYFGYCCNYFLLFLLLCLSLCFFIIISWTYPFSLVRLLNENFLKFFRVFFCHRLFLMYKNRSILK